MAPSSSIGSVTDELVRSLVPGNTTLSELRKLKDNFNKQLRHHVYARTNQFEVVERLEGLQEKLLILNHDDLADALYARLRELKQVPSSLEKWLPEILHLLLQLSDDPMRRTEVNDLGKDKTLVEGTRPLRWAEVEAEDPIDRRSKIWENADFSDLSSDDEIVIASTQLSSPGASQKHERADEVPHENSSLVDRDLTSKDDVFLPARQEIWKVAAEGELILTESEAVRETLFMLQGLPTMLFWRVDHSIEVDSRFRLHHASLYLLRDILDSFVSIGLRLDSVRAWLGRPQTDPVMQSLRVGVERSILDFDSCMSYAQLRLLAPQRLTVVSLAKVLEDTTEDSRVVMQLATFVEKLKAFAPDSIECLDLLYTTICSCQALGDEDLVEHLGHLFLNLFEVYLRPVRGWIDLGEVEPTPTPMFFEETTQEKSLRSLWQDWYKLKDEPGRQRVPRFMQPFVHQIFVTGKTVVFLHHLPNRGQGRLLEPMALALPESLSLPPLGLLPFSGKVETAIKHAIQDVHKSSATQLREKLGNECGLWRTLDGLQSVFLGKLGWIMDAIDVIVFERIDQGNGAWNDRYLLTELCRNRFQAIESIDTDRITVCASRKSLRDMQSQRRSVKMLENFTLGYSLPWPVANVVSNGALQSYISISTFLFQIRRARYVLERRCLLTVTSGRLSPSSGEHRLAQAIHFQLLIFVNYLYDHLTLFTIEHATTEMRQKLAAAIDVDGMIQAHLSYMSKLEETCLVSWRFGAIKSAITTVLDLCIRFSDTTSSPRGQRLSIDTPSLKSAPNRLQSRPGRQTSEASSTEDESSDSEGFSTFIKFDEKSYGSELSEIKHQFDRHRSFIVAGLKSIARVEQQSTGWDILAERLDWNTSRKP